MPLRQKEIPALFMRGGTSRGPYFNRADLPDDLDALARVLIAVIGAGHPLNIDGIGGGNAVTTKVAMLSKSADDWADIDYFFAQVSVAEKQVDFAPTCGNILSAVGPAALEMGLVDMTGDKTRVKIRSVNTGAKIEAVIETPKGADGGAARFVAYDGSAKIAGVAGSAAPIILNFMDVIGSKTGKLFPTGNYKDIIDGIEVSCMDVAMPMVIARASDFGITGYESQNELDENTDLFARFEPLRIKAGVMMGLGTAQELKNSVVPKFALLAAPRHGGAISARYFMPWKAHPSYAVTGSICTGSCLLADGTIAAGLAKLPTENPANICIEHPSGVIDVVFDYENNQGDFSLHSAGFYAQRESFLRVKSACLPIFGHKMEQLFSLAQINAMDWQTLALICFIALTTAAIHGATGVAGGFLLTSALALVIGVKPIVPVVSVALLISHTTRALLNIGAFNRVVFLTVTLPALPFIFIFALLYGYLSAPVIAVFLGIVILASVPLRRWAARRKIIVSKKQLGTAGAIYGTLSGASIGGGMLLVPFLLGYGLRKEAFVATLAAIALATNIARVGVYGGTDLLSDGYFMLGVLVGLMTIPGNWFGRSVLRRISSKKHGFFVDILSVLGGLNFFWLAWRG